MRIYYRVVPEAVRRAFVEDGMDIGELQIIEVNPEKLTQPERERIYRLREQSALYAAADGTFRLRASGVPFLASRAYGLMGDVMALVSEVEAALRDERCAKDDYNAQREEWILEHGSRELRELHAEGYGVNRLYILDRAQREYPDYLPDYDAVATTEVCFHPSDEATLEASRVGGTVVWLVRPPRYQGEEVTWRLSCERHRPGEAVMLERYLGRYRLFRSFGGRDG